MPARSLPRVLTLDYLLSRIEPREDGCWLWTGPVWHGTKAYGRWTGATRNGETAHRAVYRDLVGPVDGLVVDHLCHNADTSCPGAEACYHRLCVRPEHLEAVSQRDNVWRGQLPSGTCRQGHAMTEANAYVRPDTGARYCRLCKANRQRERVARLRAATARTKAPTSGE